MELISERAGTRFNQGTKASEIDTAQTSHFCYFLCWHFNEKEVAVMQSFWRNQHFPLFEARQGSELDSNHEG